MKKKRLSKPAAMIGKAILPEIRALIESARRNVLTVANLAMVDLYWRIGRTITRDIQQNRKRAHYGQRLLETLARSLTRDYGRGYSGSNLWDMRRLYEGFEILQAVPVESGATSILQAAPVELVKQSVGGLPGRIRIDFRLHSFLGWTHYRTLLGIRDERKRRFYFDRAVRERWPTRELERQIDGMLYERVALSRDTRALVKLERRKSPRPPAEYAEAFKDPYLLDFLGLKGAYAEKDIEAAIIRNLEDFLSELGSEFCFIGRQYRMRIDDDDYYLDLLFYHRGLRCLVAIDLKLGVFAAADKGQMDLYLAWLKENEWREGENEPVGLVLCSSKKRQHVELLLRGGPHKIQVSEYLMKLPPKKVLEDRLRVYSRLLEKGRSTGK